MTIKSITLEHTNPSLGPHETRTTVTLLATTLNSQKIEAFINTSKVNQTASLQDYLEAVRAKNTTLVDRVLSNAPIGKLNQGASISNLSFQFEDGQNVVLSDVYRRFQLSHFKPEFTSYMVEMGTVLHTESSYALNEQQLKNEGPDMSTKTKHDVE